MVLSNAERQRRYRQKLRALAEKGGDMNVRLFADGDTIDRTDIEISAMPEVNSVILYNLTADQLAYRVVESGFYIGRGGSNAWARVERIDSEAYKLIFEG